MERQQGRRIAPMSLSEGLLIDNLRKSEQIRKDKQKAIELEQSRARAEHHSQPRVFGLKRGLTKKLSVRQKPRGKNATKRARYLKTQKRRVNARG